MPWEVKKQGDQFCVVVKEGPKKGKVVKCHASEDKAKAQVRALYANTSEKEFAQMSAQDRLQVKLARALGEDVLLKLAKVFVPPYLREKGGKVEHVDSYTRDVDFRSKFRSFLNAQDPSEAPITGPVQGNYAFDRSTPAPDVVKAHLDAYAAAGKWYALPVGLPVGTDSLGNQIAVGQRVHVGAGAHKGRSGEIVDWDQSDPTTVYVRTEGFVEPQPISSSQVRAIGQRPLPSGGFDPSFPKGAQPPLDRLKAAERSDFTGVSPQQNVNYGSDAGPPVPPLDSFGYRHFYSQGFEDGAQGRSKRSGIGGDRQVGYDRGFMDGQRKALLDREGLRPGLRPEQQARLDAANAAATRFNMQMLNDANDRGVTPSFYADFVREHGRPPTPRPGSPLYQKFLQETGQA